jgi:cellulose synthase/poly-beta-1,6-N-acetylglucosamine synthase-like glycosyltransferase
MAVYHPVVSTVLVSARRILIYHQSIARYFGLVVNTIAHWLYKPIPIPKSPTYSYEDVTIILPTISTNVEELRQTIQNMLACHPSQILLVTTEHQYKTLQKFSESMNARNLKVLKIPVANKRLQVCKAIPFVKTRITVMADDDVTWPSTIFPWLLAPFEDEKMGAVGTSQRVRRLKTGTFIEWCYNWLSAVYIERRNFEISATHYIDGGTSCMSGRTCAFRTEILQDNYFLLGFTTETWRGHLLNADDDNFITRWLVAKRWKTWVQYNRECEIETTLENNPKFRRQCSRWARSNWRSNYTSLFIEKHIWR